MADVVTMDKIISLCRRRGFIFQSSEIYGGLNGAYDYGPMGVELKNNIRDFWWKEMTRMHDNIVGLDASILMHPRVWEASGHVSNFTDPMVDCKVCKSRFRADQIDLNAPCPVCGNKGTFTEPRNFNLMFETSRGVTEDSQNKIYLRPETAQGEFVNFQNVQRSTRAKVPFGIAQIGKAFRNEITPGNFIFRTIEFEQMEHQWFCKEGTDIEYYEKFKKAAFDFLVSLNFAPEHLRFKDHEKLAHYAKCACDIQYLFPIGWSELNGIHNRTDYDLSRHQEYSGKNMQYVDPITGEKYIPYVIEYSIGADRLMLAVLSEAYDEETLEGGETRVVMHFHPALAAYKVAVLPLQKKELGDKAREVYKELSRHFMCTYDDAGSIGKRYRRQDEIGTPYCVTIDFDTLENGTVTVRDRDTMEQIRLPISELAAYVEEKIRLY